VRNLEIRGRNVKAGGATAAGVLAASGARNITIKHVLFLDANRVCIGINHTDGVAVTGCHFRNVGMALDAVFSSHLRICGNQLSGARIHGFEIWGNWSWKKRVIRDVIIKGNVIHNGGAGAIWVTGATGVIMANNIVDGAKDVGLDLEWCNNSVITGNIVSQCRNAGISLFYSCQRITITGNTVCNDRPISSRAARAKWWVRSGIWLTYPNTKMFKRDSGNRDVTIADNTIYCSAGKRRAVWIGSGSDHVTLNGNTIDGGGVWYGGHQGVHPLALRPLGTTNTEIIQPFKKVVSAGRN
jgi:parallel beta-helix repeat protein